MPESASGTPRCTASPSAGDMSHRSAAEPTTTARHTATFTGAKIVSLTGTTPTSGRISRFAVAMMSGALPESPPCQTKRPR